MRLVIAHHQPARACLGDNDPGWRLIQDLVDKRVARLKRSQELHPLSFRALLRGDIA